jgi:hypothetical protein
LAQKPLNGGTPAIESARTVMVMAKGMFTRARPEKSPMVSIDRPARLAAIRQANRPRLSAM